MTNYDIQHRDWWVLRWLDLLDKYRFKKRLERGRTYAREGNILAIDFQGSEVNATVQGTADEPYELRIWLDRFSDEDWDNVIDTLVQKAKFSAQLLASTMPEDIEAAFVSSGLSLFPFNLSEVHAECNCPDPQNPCKHIAAVYYELGDRFSEDPFVLFRLRGRTREQILDQIRQRRARSAKPVPKETAAVAKAALAAPAEPNGSEDGDAVSEFWRYDEPLDSSLAEITPSSQSTVLELLGWLPLPAEEGRAIQLLVEQTYDRAREQGTSLDDPTPEDS